MVALISWVPSLLRSMSGVATAETSECEKEVEDADK